MFDAEIFQSCGRGPNRGSVRVTLARHGNAGATFFAPRLKNLASNIGYRSAKEALVVAKLDASEVAGLLEEYDRRTMLLGGNPYRAKAYIRAAENLALLTEPLETVVAEGRLREISGVGKATADIIDKLSRCQRPVQV
jgi:hypothetical protein